MIFALAAASSSLEEEDASVFEGAKELADLTGKLADLVGIAASSPDRLSSKTSRSTKKKKRTRKTSQTRSRATRPKIAKKITIKRNEVDIEGLKDSSIYTICRKWVGVGGLSMIIETDKENENVLPYPTVQTKESLTRAPPNEERFSNEKFEEIISRERNIEELKKELAEHSKLMHDWHQRQHLHRLIRYRERINILCEEVDGKEDQPTTA